MIGLSPSHAGSRAIAINPAQFSKRVPLQFRLLHVAGFMMTLPVVASSRMLNGRSQEQRDEHRDESIFAETNRTVLTALGLAFMA